MTSLRVETAQDTASTTAQRAESPEQGYWIERRRRELRAYRKQIVLFWRAMERYAPRMTKEQFFAETEARFLALLPALPLQPGSKRQLFNVLMPVLGTAAAAFSVLTERGYNVDQVGRLSYEAFLQFFGELPAPLRLAMRSFMVSRLFESFIRPACAAMTFSGRADTFFIEYAYQRRPSPVMRMTCWQCAMVTFMERNGLGEMKRLCNVFDFAQAEALGLGLQQPSCIGAGDAVCRYVYTKDRRATVLPPNIVAFRRTPMDV